MKNNVRASVTNEFQGEMDGRVPDVPDADLEVDPAAIKDTRCLPLAACSDFKVRVSVHGAISRVEYADESHCDAKSYLTLHSISLPV
jgi:hypothetical protein